MSKDATKTQCWACNHEIDSGQKLCSNCNSWQDYRRFLRFSNSTISLIAASISVVAAVFATFSSILTREKHDISAAVLINRFDGNGESIEFRIRNLGSNPVLLPEFLNCRTFRYGHTESSDNFSMITADDRYVGLNAANHKTVVYVPFSPHKNNFENQKSYLCSVPLRSIEGDNHPQYFIGFELIGISAEKYASFEPGPAPHSPYE